MLHWLLLHRLVSGTCCAEGAKGDLLAMQLTFQLAPSCYATMLIRELTKMATGTAFHKNLTQVFTHSLTHSLLFLFFLKRVFQKVL